MASSSFRFLSLALVLVIVGSFSLYDGVSGAECETAIPKLVTNCRQYVETSGPEIDPSKDCCNVMTNLDIPCMCKYVTPEVEKLVSMEKVVFVAEKCGLTLQPGMKCGSYTVPPHVSGFDKRTGGNCAEMIE